MTPKVPTDIEGENGTDLLPLRRDPARIQPYDKGDIIQVSKKKQQKKAKVNPTHK